MFTGIVEATGKIARADRAADGGAVTLVIATALDPGELGASLAIDGTCLTVTAKTNGALTLVVGPETLAKTTLGSLRAGDEVNLERPMRLSDRLGGHLVLGHVDATGTIERKTPLPPAVELWIAAPPEIMRYIIVKGSIAVDGISLTVNRATETAFCVTLIPHTLAATTLDRKPAGARVNLEADLIGKYVERLFEARAAGFPPGGLSLDKLKEHGFAD
jgi:riboflavin synthase